MRGRVADQGHPCAHGAALCGDSASGTLATLPLPCLQPVSTTNVSASGLVSPSLPQLKYGRRQTGVRQAVHRAARVKAGARVVTKHLAPLLETSYVPRSKICGGGAVGGSSPGWGCSQTRSPRTWLRKRPRQWRPRTPYTHHNDRV